MCVCLRGFFVVQAPSGQLRGAWGIKRRCQISQCHCLAFFNNERIEMLWKSVGES